MDDYTIKFATSDDIPSILLIEEECGLSPWSAGDYKAEMRRADGIVLIALGAESRAIIGFIVGRASDGIDQAEIYNIGIRPASRQKKVGTALLRRFIQICELRGVSTIELDVRESNQNAKFFYRSLGFTKDGTRRGFYTFPTEDSELMSLDLQAKRADKGA